MKIAIQNTMSLKLSFIRHPELDSGSVPMDSGSEAGMT